jgi:hypothetical protein
MRDHGGAIHHQALAMKRRLSHAPFAQPYLAAAGQQSITEDAALEGQAQRHWLYEISITEHALDVLRVIEKVDGDVKKPQANNVAKFASRFG